MDEIASSKDKPKCPYNYCAAREGLEKGASECEWVEYWKRMFQAAAEESQNLRKIITELKKELSNYR